MDRFRVMLSDFTVLGTAEATSPEEAAHIVLARHPDLEGDVDVWVGREPPCPTCKAAGVESDVTRWDTESTMMATLGGLPDGHVHDPNRITDTFECAAGHEWRAARFLPCPIPGCTWRSRLDK